VKQRLALLAALLLTLTGFAGVYSEFEFVGVGSGTNSVLTNAFSGQLGRDKAVPTQTAGAVAAFKSASGASGAVTFNILTSYDTNYPTIWKTNLTFSLSASGTNVVAIPTNFTLGDFGFVRVTATNAVGSPVSNLTFRLFYKQ
jgi:hypothetical protein